MEVNPLSIIFVKSDSKGDRLLFRYPFATDVKDEQNQELSGHQNPYSLPLHIVEDLLQAPLPQTSNIFKGQLTGFTDECLSTLFAVKAELCNRKFELKVNDVRFVGHPTLLPYRSNKDDSATMILINIVFALHASASHSIVKCYYDLSKRLGKALRHEEKRCSYLSEEMKLMIAAHDEVSALDSESNSGEAEEPEEPPAYPMRNVPRSTDAPPRSAFHLILQRSSLARSLTTVFEDLSNTGIVQVRINKWVLVSFCLPHKAHQIHNTGLVIEPETIDKCLRRLRPYHGMLLMVNPNELLESMPLDGSAALLRLIKLYSPLKSLQTIALEADLTLTQVFQLTGHLVYWAKATIIYPLCESNVYVVSPTASVHAHSPLLQAFAQEFPGLCLLQVLAEFSLPAPLWYHARCGAGGGADGSRLARITAWLLRRRLLLQLHTYVQFNHAHWGRDHEGKEYYCEKHGNLNKSLSESFSSLNLLPSNIPEPLDTRNGITQLFLDPEENYPTENHLNVTDFSHTKPIEIESDTRIDDSANHSFDDGVDVVEGVIKNNLLKNNSKHNNNNKLDEKDYQLEKKLNGTSVDSGISNLNGKTIENGINGTHNDGHDETDGKLSNTSLNDKISQLSSKETTKVENGEDQVDSISEHTRSPRQASNSSLLSTTSSEKKNGVNLNLKIHNETSFQPPTVVWQGGADGGGGCAEGADALSEAALLRAFSDAEREAIRAIPAAHQPEDLALLAQLHSKGYFRGEQHLEEIMFMENLTRSQVMQLIDKFRELLITFETEDPAIALLYPYH